MNNINHEHLGIININNIINLQIQQIYQSVKHIESIFIKFSKYLNLNKDLCTVLHLLISDNSVFGVILWEIKPVTSKPLCVECLRKRQKRYSAKFETIKTNFFCFLV